MDLGGGVGAATTAGGGQCGRGEEDGGGVSGASGAILSLQAETS